MVISLMVILKGLVGIIHHLHAVVRNIASKLKVRWYVKRYNDELISKVQINIHVCCDEEGNLYQDLQYRETFVHFDGNSKVTPGYNFEGCECWGGL